MLVSLSQLLIVFIIFCKYGFANHIILLLAHLTQLTFSLARVTYFFELLVLKKLNDFIQLQIQSFIKPFIESFIKLIIELCIESLQNH